MKLAIVATIAAVGLAAQANAFGCNPEEITGWIQACDAVSGADREAMCHDRECHKALHRLVEEETRDCYVSSGMGPDPSALDWYIKLDDFCHGDAQDPGDKPVTTSAPPTDAPTTAPPANVTESPTPTYLQC